VRRKAATASIGTTMTREDLRPKARTSGVIRIGPVATPRFPPVEKMLIPVARLLPET
jgi:hypothetical protein